MSTCRDEILDVLPELASRKPDGTFTVQEVVEALRARDSTNAVSTIEAHVSSRMCANAPDNHAVVYRDIERVGLNRYRIRAS